ncbi:hypothetical protein QVZ43_08595 [Marinobacter sp. chi1]|uniref:Uncharacterized protein n=1 Tax=Marinobacter suaedae TaxID=3057675 RepID=A0ABT8W0M6_9GAMM|nr:hypothetical protein [Marinobacter sp. chi1]MDO3721784.1 hypothetical protein [Marinobacter sp. chi1]
MLKKLASLKRWLTLEDAASHLSLIFDESVTCRDLIQLACEEQLTLSLIIPDATQVVPYRETPNAHNEYVPSSDPREDPAALIALLRLHTRLEWAFAVNREKLFEPEFEHLTQASGLWSLPMIEHTANPSLLGQQLKSLLSTDAPSRNETDLDPRLGPIVLQHSETQEYYALVHQTEIFEDTDTTDWEPKDYVLPQQRLPRDSSIVVSQPHLRQLIDSLTDNNLSLSSTQPINQDLSQAGAEPELRRTQRALAALAIGLAERHPTYRHGTKPNALQLARIATEHLRDETSDRTPHGFSETIVRQAISDSLKACPEFQK